MNDKHANHCFDYLRQSLQCAADTSLEWPKPGTQIVNGWGMPHLCRSWVSFRLLLFWKGIGKRERADVFGI
jgi:hypothetical protein